MSSNTLFEILTWHSENLENATNRVEPVFTEIH